MLICVSLFYLNKSITSNEIMAQRIIGACATRSISSNWLYGPYLKDLRETTLPTELDLICNYYYMRDLIEKVRTTSDEKAKLILNKIVSRLIFIWEEKGNIPARTEKAVYTKLKLLIDKATDYAKKEKQFIDSKPNPEGEIEGIRKKHGKCFDIAACKCFTKAESEEKIIEMFFNNICQCDKNELKIPQSEIEFYSDQLFKRQMVIMGVDVAATKEKEAFIVTEMERLNILEKRKATIEDRKKRQSADFSTVAIDTVFSDDDDEPNSNNDNHDEVPELPQPQDQEQQQPEPLPSTSTKKYCKIDFRNFTLSALRYNCSTRCCRALINNLILDLKNHGVIKEGLTDEELMVSAWKVSEMRYNYGFEASLIHSDNSKCLQCIKFDGKKDKCLLPQSKTRMQENVTVISEPGSKYVDHFIPKSGKAAHIANELYDLLVETDSLHSLSVIGADGTNVNTGWKGGAIRELELKLGNIILKMSHKLF